MNMEHKQTLSFGAADTAESVTLSQVVGKVHTIIMKVPNWTNNVTAILSATNDAGDEVWVDETARARNNTYVFHEMREMLPIGWNITFTVTLSGAPGGAGGNVELSVYVE